MQGRLYANEGKGGCDRRAPTFPSREGVRARGTISGLRAGDSVAVIASTRREEERQFALREIIDRPAQRD
jgi:hypothetical protein